MLDDAWYSKKYRKDDKLDLRLSFKERLVRGLSRRMPSPM